MDSITGILKRSGYGQEPEMRGILRSQASGIPMTQLQRMGIETPAPEYVPQMVPYGTSGEVQTVYFPLAEAISGTVGYGVKEATGSPALGFAAEMMVPSPTSMVKGLSKAVLGGGPMMSVAPRIKTADVITSDFGRIPKTGDAVYSMADMLESAGNKAGYIVTRDSSGASSSQYLTFTKPGDDAGEFTRQIRLATHADKYPEQASGIRMSVDPSTENTFEQATRWLAKEGFPTRLSDKYKDINTFGEHLAAQRVLHDLPEAKLERATSAWRNKPKATRGPQPTIEQFSDQPTLADVVRAAPQDKALRIAQKNAADIRSRFAAFDPARRNEADLLGAVDPKLLPYLAGGAALGMYGIGMASKDENK